jgi:hypothetical protein
MSQAARNRSGPISPCSKGARWMPSARRASRRARLVEGGGAACANRRLPGQGYRTRRAGSRRCACRCIEIGDPVHSEQHGLAIQDELVGSDAPGCRDDQRIAAGPVVAVASEQPDPVTVPLDDQAEAVLLHLVNPTGVIWDLCPARRDARLERCFGHIFLEIGPLCNATTSNARI